MAHDINSRNRAEWLQERHACFGASDAPAVMGRSQYGSREALIEEKAKPLEITSNPWLEKEKEAGEREAVERYLQLTFGDTWSAIYVSYQHMLSFRAEGIHRPISCTLDALVMPYDSSAIALEVKCVDKASDGDGVPAKYYHQILQQHMVIKACLKDKWIRTVYIEYSSAEKKILKIAEPKKFPYQIELLRAYRRAEKDIEKAKESEGMGVAEGTRIRLYALADRYSASRKKPMLYAVRFLLW
jgi:hypothetical protein